MLPTSTRGNTVQKDSALGAAYGATATYNVHSNDVLEGRLRVTVEESATGRSKWFSERMSTEHEIVETVKDSASQIVKWTIHRPKSGWYIRLRSPSFPPGSSVGFLPVEVPEAETGSGTLSFLCQTHIDLTPPPPAYGTPDTSDSTRRTSESTSNTDHTYPPSPCMTNPQNSPPPFSRTSTALVSSSSDSVATLIPTSPYQGTSGPVATRNSSPTVRTTADPQVRSEVTRFFARTVPRHGQNGTNRLSFLPATLLGAPNKNFVIQTSSGALPPVLMYHDTTPLLGANNSSGTIELDHGVARCLGIEPSWWIAVALAYVEFLEERDGYLAAAGG